MLIEELSHIITKQVAVASHHLKRQVIVDLYIAKQLSSHNHLLLINDGQDLPDMPFDKMLDGLFATNQIEPLICVGIHASKDRRNEYGTASQPDYAGRGAKAGAYEKFILEELLPYLFTELNVERFETISYAGFSLGGLTAMDLAWHHPEIFTRAGVFSGSLWWRSKDLGEGYDDNTDRIMHQLIREGNFSAGLQFYFTTGSLDETADRNNNGIIDSIDDTLALIEELKKKGYEEKDIKYINYDDGRHDVATWARALPPFLLWGWKKLAEPSRHHESC